MVDPDSEIDSRRPTAAERIAISKSNREILLEFWQRFRVNRGAVAGLVIVSIIILLAIFAGFIAPFDPYSQDRSALLIPPIWQSDGRWPFILGTDELGRDMLSRILHGARYSLFIGFNVVLLSVTIGTMLGITAAYLSGWIGMIIMRIMDIILSIPSLLLALVAVAILGASLGNVIIAVTLVQIPHYTRLARAAALTELQREYTVAARLAGQPVLLLILVSILPNCLSPLVVQASLGFSTAVLDAAAMGFLGMGAQPPLPEWGNMLANSREFILRAWWVVTIPGIAILLTVLAFNLIGDGLRDSFDPRLQDRKS